MKNINDMALMKVKDERKRQNLLFLLDDIDSAYKREAYGAAFICCLILPDICSSIDRNDGKQSADTDYIDWWNENISPLFKADLVITKKNTPIIYLVQLGMLLDVMFCMQQTQKDLEF
ncbi:hypothetical protein [Enterococcus alishanensis]|uniref:Uncharacterized protein n=1 Tax=Enterococcus alishanensis TaxID=1303817 RepID=A0ABS6THT6_9ENTE|nr:hypothetical protein [Enterococcus alishanensis]MBV7392508.1 hypothetical protein [Enterococcus alishanensis]